MYVVPKAMVFRPIANSPVRKASLPHFELFSKLSPDSVRITALDELHGSLQGDCRWSHNQMQVIRHQHEFMQEKFLLLAIEIKRVDEKIRDHIGLEEESLLICARGYEIRLFCTNRGQSGRLGHVHLSG
jgi:hypothetical protein